jgi:transposase
VKTDRAGLTAIADLLLAGRGVPVALAGEELVELAAWVAHRSRRVQVRTATKNQVLGQLDRAFPGLSGAVRDVLGTKVGRLVAAHFTDPAPTVRT